MWLWHLRSPQALTHGTPAGAGPSIFSKRFRPGRNSIPLALVANLPKPQKVLTENTSTNGLTDSLRVELAWRGCGFRWPGARGEAGRTNVLGRRTSELTGLIPPDVWRPIISAVCTATRHSFPYAALHPIGYRQGDSRHWNEERMDSSQVGAAAGEYLDGTRKQAEEQGGFGTAGREGHLGRRPRCGPWLLPLLIGDGRPGSASVPPPCLLLR